MICALLLAVNVLVPGTPVPSGVLLATDDVVQAEDLGREAVPSSIIGDMGAPPAATSSMAWKPPRPFFVAAAEPAGSSRAKLAGVLPGTRVRLRSPALARRATGVVEDVDDYHVTVRLEGSPVAMRFGRTDIAQLEVSRGRRTHAAEGAIFGGFLLGPTLTVGVHTLGSIGRMSCGPECRDPSTGDYLKAGVVMLAIGAGIGALIGAAIETEGWRPVPLTPLRAQVGPGRHGGLTASLTLRF